MARAPHEKRRLTTGGVRGRLEAGRGGERRDLLRVGEAAGGRGAEDEGRMLSVSDWRAGDEGRMLSVSVLLGAGGSGAPTKIRPPSKIHVLPTHPKLPNYSVRMLAHPFSRLVE